jgi:LETM1 and EF-hand domain-containing protein 1, mitochondrial
MQQMQQLRSLSSSSTSAAAAGSNVSSHLSRRQQRAFSAPSDWTVSLGSKDRHGDHGRSFGWSSHSGSSSNSTRGFASSALPSPQPSTPNLRLEAQPPQPPPLDDETSKRSASTLAAPSSPSPSSVQQPTADLCDFALSELDTTRSKIESATRSTYKPQSWLQKVAGAATTAVTATASFAATLVATPARVVSFFATKSKQERKLVYAGWWSHAKAEARHYWAGTKLLWAEVKIASRLVAAAARGRALTRRERRQLTRTVADVFRLVPVAVFLVVPFMEFLLPIALKLFPNMLPSTFETALQREEALKRRVKAKLEVARFLQDTVAELAKDMKNSSRSSGATQASAAELYAFMKRVRGGEPVSAAEVTRFASLFSDELTLDNLDRTQLASLCRFAGIQPFGTDAFLASRLRSHLSRIKADDRAIRDEGLGSLSDDELRSACRARGMRAPFGEGARLYMERQMEEWLDLSLARQLPSSLLLLSRAFTVTAPFVSPAAKREEVDLAAAAAAAEAAASTLSTGAASTTILPAPIPASTSADVARLRETLGVLPDEAIEAASLEAAAAAGTAEGAAAADKAVALERKLESLRREEELIEEEAKDAAAAFGGAGEDAAAVAAAAASALDASRLIAASNASAASAAEAASVAATTTAATTPQQTTTTTTTTTATPPPPSLDTAADALAAGAAAAVVKEAAAAASLPSSVSEPPFDFDFVGGESAEERAAYEAATKEARMRKVLSALAALASTSGVAAERGEFMDLVKKEVDRLNAGASARGAPSLVFRSSGAAVAERPKSTGLLEADTSAANLGAARLSGQVPAILARIERELDAVDARIGERMHVLDEDNDGVISEEELKRALGFLRESLGEDELRTLLERLQRAKVDQNSGSASGETFAPFPGETTSDNAAAATSSSSSSATPLAAATAASGFDVAHLMQLAAEENKGADGDESGSSVGSGGEKKL